MEQFKGGEDRHDLLLSGRSRAGVHNRPMASEVAATFGTYGILGLKDPERWWAASSATAPPYFTNLP